MTYQRPKLSNGRTWIQNLRVENSRIGHRVRHYRAYRSHTSDCIRCRSCRQWRAARLIRTLLLAPLVLVVPLFAWPLISVPKKGYAVRDKDILYKSGVFWRTVTAIPFNRIQHVEKSSTPLDRKFNLASLQLFTAGGSGGDLQIHGLPARAAEKLRVFILDKIGSTLEKN